MEISFGEGGGDEMVVKRGEGIGKGGGRRGSGWGKREGSKESMRGDELFIVF